VRRPLSLTVQGTTGLNHFLRAGTLLSPPLAQKMAFHLLFSSKEEDEIPPDRTFSPAGGCFPF